MIVDAFKTVSAVFTKQGTYIYVTDTPKGPRLHNAHNGENLQSRMSEHIYV
jgi:hypothetical protein